MMEQPFRFGVDPALHGVMWNWARSQSHLIPYSHSSPEGGTLRKTASVGST
jgi:hypothetical protein